MSSHRCKRILLLGMSRDDYGCETLLLPRWAQLTFNSGNLFIDVGELPVGGRKPAYLLKDQLAKAPQPDHAIVKPDRINLLGMCHFNLLPKDIATK
jgi:hypothetical protein